MCQDRSAQSEGIEITPEMIEAGVHEMLTFDRDWEPAEQALKRVLVSVFGPDAITFHEVEHIAP